MLETLTYCILLVFPNHRKCFFINILIIGNTNRLKQKVKWCLQVSNEKVGEWKILTFYTIIVFLTFYKRNLDPKKRSVRIPVYKYNTECFNNLWWTIRIACCAAFNSNNYGDLFGNIFMTLIGNYNIFRNSLQSKHIKMKNMSFVINFKCQEEITLSESVRFMLL